MSGSATTLWFDFGSGKHLVVTNRSVPAANYPGKRLWIIGIRSPTYPISTLYKTKTGRIIGGIGQYCVNHPGTCSGR